MIKKIYKRKSHDYVFQPPFFSLSMAPYFEDNSGQSQNLQGLQFLNKIMLNGETKNLIQSPLKPKQNALKMLEKIKILTIKHLDLFIH